MDVRIGTTLDGRAVGFDTTSPRPLLLVGDVGRGKTTLARYLLRWWLANTVRHAHVFAQTPSEWADLRCGAEHPDSLEEPVGRGCPPGSCLVVVDDLHLTSDKQLALLPLGSARTILTSHGGSNLAGRSLFESGVTCLGLVRREPSDPADAAVLDGQGRLDWPPRAVPVVTDQRGPRDFPCHRWHAPSDWAAVAR
jgi:hypothetical protein